MDTIISITVGQLLTAIIIAFIAGVSLPFAIVINAILNGKFPDK